MVFDYALSFIDATRVNFRWRLLFLRLGDLILVCGFILLFDLSFRSFSISYLVSLSIIVSEVVSLFFVLVIAHEFVSVVICVHLSLSVIAFIYFFVSGTACDLDNCCLGLILMGFLYSVVILQGAQSS